MSSQQDKISLPSYQEITDVQIEETALNSLLKLNHTKCTEGLLFGRETNKSILITSAMPCNLTPSATNNLINYLENNHLDYMRVGFFTVNEETELITKQKMRTYLEFQKSFPNCVIIAVDINMKNALMYPFKCYRIDKALMEKIDMYEIEEDINITPSTIEEFYNNFFKRFSFGPEILKELKFKIIEDDKRLFKVLADKRYMKNTNENNEDDEIGKGVEQNSLKYSINRKITELNKNCEKFIEEQKMYINFYKMKKNYGKAKDIEFIQQMSKKGNELSKMDKIDINITTKNIKNMQQQINNLLKKNEVNNYTSLKLAQ